MLGQALLAAAAVAASSGGITPFTPTAGVTVPAGTQPLFSGKVRGEGSVWVHVSTSRKARPSGVIGDEALLQRARRKDGRFRVRAPFFDFPEFWLNTPGRYFWQAYRIVPPCPTNAACYRPGPIVKFKVG